jgi:catechol 2,3-dioxygenase
MGPHAAFLSAGGYHHHIGLNTWESEGGSPPPPGSTGLYHVAIRYPNRAALGDALRRLIDSDIRLDGASDHGVSEALYLHDPDGNGIELYWDRPRDQWPHASDGSLRMTTERLDVDTLLEEARRAAAAPRAGAPAPGAPAPVPMVPATKTRLNDLRTRLLALHKALLDDAKVAYEMDRGRIGSAGTLLQLVINDPWFAWLHQLSELVVRIDEMTAADSTASESDARALFEQVERLLRPSESGDSFARRYYEALQRQPAVVLAHGDVRRVLKGA